MTAPQPILDDILARSMDIVWLDCYVYESEDRELDNPQQLIKTVNIIISLEGRLPRASVLC